MKWNDNLSYNLSWDVCSLLKQISDLNLHVQILTKCFVTTLYFAICDFTHMLKYDEMSLTHVSWHIYSCLYVQILTKRLQWLIFAIRDRVCIKIWLLFVCFNSNEMFWQLIYISFLTFCCITCENTLNFNEISWQTIYISQFAMIFLINICFKMFLSKCSIKCVSRQRFDQKLFVWTTFFYNFIRFTIFLYWFQNAFHINIWSKIVSRERCFFIIFQIWWHVN